MALNEKRDFHGKVECDLYKCRQISLYDKLMKIRGSIYDHFPLGGLARRVTRISFFQKEFRKVRYTFFENARKLMKIGLNGSAVGPHGPILCEVEATACTMPLDAFPTPFWVVLGRF